MSEYQRYEFMTADRPLTHEQLREVNRLSSHIEASSTHALIEYHWGDFKHDPIEVLYSYFDGFLYWANWGAHQLAFRFPHGALPPNLLADYNDLDDHLEFTQRPDFDLLDIHVRDEEPPDEWIDYELAPLMPIRDELMDGDLRALYIVWLAAMAVMGSYDQEEQYDIGAPPTPPGLGKLTGAQEALAELLQVPAEMIIAAARHSAPAKPITTDDATRWLPLLPAERRDDYLRRLARNEPGLSRQLVTELRALRPGQGVGDEPAAEHPTYASLLPEGREIAARWEVEQRERQRQQREQHVRHVHEHADDHWRRATEAAERGSGPGYDEATNLLIELREVARHFDEAAAFEARFQAWVAPHLRRPAFVKRLQAQRFATPTA